MNENNRPAVARVLADGGEPMNPDALLSMLELMGIEHEVLTHPPLRTVEDAKRIRPKTDYGHTKNLFVRNKKGKMWLLTLHEDRQVDLKQVAQTLGAGRFSFGSAERLMRYLGVIPGAVSPFAMLNDTSHQVSFVIDEALMSHPKWHIHPLDNRMTVTLERQALLEK